MIAPGLLLCLTGGLLWLSWEDARTTAVSAWLVFLCVALAFGVVASAPFPGTSLVEHLAGGGLGFALGCAVAMKMAPKPGVPALGGADPWVLLAGSLVVGIQWFGPMMLLASLVGMGLFPLLKRHGEDEGFHIPFIPVLAVSALGVAWSRWFTLLPPSFSFF